jgi:hypothetical protein
VVSAGDSRGVTLQVFLPVLAPARLTTGGKADVDAAIAGPRERSDGPLYTLVMFDPDDVEVPYVADRTYDRYPDEGAMLDHFERIFDYLRIDFAERARYTDVLLAGAADVMDMTTCLESVEAVRAYDDVTGVFMSVDPDEHVPPLVDVVVEHLF